LRYLYLVDGMASMQSIHAEHLGAKLLTRLPHLEAVSPPDPAILTPSPISEPVGVEA
jgi:hypothetical protein